MRRYIIAGLVTLAVASPALAQVGQANPENCWSVPAATVGAVEATITASLDPNGVPRSAQISDYRPQTPEGRSAAEAARRAVVACGPYPGRQGTVIFRMSR